MPERVLNDPIVANHSEVSGYVTQQRCAPLIPAGACYGVIQPCSILPTLFRQVVLLFSCPPQVKCGQSKLRSGLRGVLIEGNARQDHRCWVGHLRRR